MSRGSAAQAGSAWPGGEYGEVVNAHGERSYMARTAGEIAGRTTRWATNLARQGRVTSSRAHVIGRQGPPVWFLDAQSFEEYCKNNGGWPPNSSSDTNWPDLLRLQDIELERSRSALANAIRQIDELEKRISMMTRDRTELLSVIQTLSNLRARDGL